MHALTRHSLFAASVLCLLAASAAAQQQPRRLETGPRGGVRVPLGALMR